MKKLLLLLSLAVLALPARAQSLPRPTGASFAKGAVFTVQGYDRTEPLSGFPVLVRLAENSPSGFSYSDLMNGSAASFDDIDIAFVDMDGNGLPFEIDTWNPSGTDPSLIWVRLPTMTNGAAFVMCWGSPSSGRAVCAAKPWADYTGVWHMNDSGDGGATVADSTENNLEGTAVSSSKAKTDGRLGGARLITTYQTNNSGTPYDSGVTVDLSDPAKLAAVDAIVPEFSASMWIRPQNTTQKSNYNYLLTRKASDKKPGWGLQFDLDDANFSPLRVFSAEETDAGNDNQGNPANKKVATGVSTGIVWQEWHKLDVVWTQTGTYAIYVDGALTSSGNLVNNVPAINGVAKLSIGGAMAAPPLNENLSGSHKNGRGFYGDMDEVRLRAGAVSTNWIAADFAAQTNPNFLGAGQALPYGATDDPVAGVLASGFYTNATITATVALMGTDASFADVTIELADSDAFASPLWTTNYTVDADGDSRTFSAGGLAFGTTYYVRAVVTNSLDAGVTASATFTTQTPGAPAGTATFVERGFTTMEATGTTTAFGTGAQSATMFLQASTSTNFATFVSGVGVAAALNEQTPLSVSGLEPGANYNLRVCISNDWGLQTFVELPSAATREVPFAVTGIGWTFSPDGETVDVTFGVSGIYDGASGAATLYFGKTPNPTASQGAQSFSAPAALEWPGLAFEADPMYAKVVLSATLNGQTYSQTYAAPIAAGSTAVAVSDVSAHMSAATAVRVHAGDVVTLPETTGDAHYFVGNELFGALDGNVLTALRPGILGVHCVGNDGATNTMAVLVLPEKIGNGDIYVYKEKTVSNHSCNWTESQRWERIGSETNDSFPHEPDDIAIIPYYDENSVQFNLPADVVLAALYVGRWQDAAGNVSLRSLSSPTHGIAFERTDGEPARIQLCPNAPLSGDNNFRAKLTIDKSIPVFGFRSDTIISGGSDRMGTTYPQGRFDFSALLFDIAAGVTVSLVEMDTHQTGSAGATMGGGRLTGGGTFWNRSAAAVRFDKNKETFTGLLRDSGGYGHLNGDRCGPTEVRSISTNCTAEAVGWIGVDSSSQPRQGWNQSVGCLYLGNDHGHGKTQVHAGTNWFPRIATLHGGRLQLCPEQTAWGAPGVLDRKYAQRFVLADGFCYLRAWSRDTSGGWPVNWFEADELGHENKATLRIDDDSRKSTASTATITNQATFLRGWASAAVGPAGDPEASDSYPIVPWIVSPIDGGNNTMCFSAFDSDGRLVRPALAANNTALSAFSAGRNAYCRNAGIALAEDLTVNSLYLQNDNKGKTLGAGRTLTVTSGGLILSDVNDNNNPGAAAIGEEDGSENGALVLGDADHPAYVWAYGATTSSANTAPNQIWAPVTAPGGFVHAYTGHLVLGGDQTGIDDEIAVNAGTLQLGTAESSCRLARDLPIRIFANATLRIPNAGSSTKSILRFDGAAGWYGKVDLPDGVSASCKKAFFRDYPESPEWQTLERGFYGSSDSGVEALATVTHPAFVRDDLFTGTGTLKVVSDDRIPPTIMILR